MELPLQDNKKLLIVYRLESNCLGLQGDSQIDDFCAHLTKNILPVHSSFIKWTVLPRLNVDEKEIEYLLDSKLLSLKQTSKYLANFDKNIADLEGEISDLILNQVEHYFC